MALSSSTIVQEDVGNHKEVEMSTTFFLPLPYANRNIEDRLDRIYKPPLANKRWERVVLFNPGAVEYGGSQLNDNATLVSTPRLVYSSSAPLPARLPLENEWDYLTRLESSAPDASSLVVQTQNKIRNDMRYGVWYYDIPGAVNFFNVRFSDSIEVPIESAEFNSLINAADETTGAAVPKSLHERRSYYIDPKAITTLLGDNVGKTTSHLIGHITSVRLSVGYLADLKGTSYGRHPYFETPAITYEIEFDPTVCSALALARDEGARVLFGALFTRCLAGDTFENASIFRNVLKYQTKLSVPTPQLIPILLSLYESKHVFADSALDFFRNWTQEEGDPSRGDIVVSLHPKYDGIKYHALIIGRRVLLKSHNGAAFIETLLDTEVSDQYLFALVEGFSSSSSSLSIVIHTITGALIYDPKTTSFQAALNGKYQERPSTSAITTQINYYPTGSQQPTGDIITVVERATTTTTPHNTTSTDVREGTARRPLYCYGQGVYTGFASYSDARVPPISPGDVVTRIPYYVNTLLLSHIHNRQRGGEISGDAQALSKHFARVLLLTPPRDDKMLIARSIDGRPIEIDPLYLFYNQWLLNDEGVAPIFARPDSRFPTDGCYLSKYNGLGRDAAIDASEATTNVGIATAVAARLYNKRPESILYGSVNLKLKPFSTCELACRFNASGFLTNARTHNNLNLFESIRQRPPPLDQSKPCWFYVPPVEQTIVVGNETADNERIAEFKMILPESEEEGHTDRERPPRAIKDIKLDFVRWRPDKTVADNNRKMMALSRDLVIVDYMKWCHYNNNAITVEKNSDAPLCYECALRTNYNLSIVTPSPLHTCLDWQANCTTFVDNITKMTTWE